MPQAFSHEDTIGVLSPTPYPRRARVLSIRLAIVRFSHAQNPWQHLGSSSFLEHSSPHCRWGLLTKPVQGLSCRCTDFLSFQAITFTPFSLLRIGCWVFRVRDFRYFVSLKYQVFI